MSIINNPHFSELAVLVGLLQDSISESANLKQLSRVWTDIGMNEAQRHERRERIVLHVNDLLEEMSSEELNLKMKLEESFESNRAEQQDLCKQLSLKEEDVSVSISQSYLAMTSCLALRLCTMLLYVFPVL